MFTNSLTIKRGLNFGLLDESYYDYISHRPLPCTPLFTKMRIAIVSNTTVKNLKMVFTVEHVGFYLEGHPEIKFQELKLKEPPSAEFVSLLIEWFCDLKDIPKHLIKQDK